MKTLINITTAAAFVIAGIASVSVSQNAQASTASEAIQRSTESSACYYIPSVGLRCF